METVVSTILEADRRTAPRPGYDRRKTVRLFRLWQRFKGGRPRPIWTPALLAQFGDLRRFCLGGRPGAAPGSLHYLGDVFRRRLVGDCPPPGNSAFPAAVLVGELSRLGEQLAGGGKELFSTGEFLDTSENVVRCRTVVLPFDLDDGGVSWIGLASWRVTAGPALIARRRRFERVPMTGRALPAHRQTA